MNKTTRWKQRYQNFSKAYEMSNEFGLPDRSYEMILDAFSRFPEIEEAIVFGSRAMGNYKRGSDVDIALKGDLNPDLILKVRILLDQELPLPYFFDIVDYQTISKKELKSHIDQEGKVLYKKGCTHPRDRENS